MYSRLMFRRFLKRGYSTTRPGGSLDELVEKPPSVFKRIAAFASGILLTGSAAAIADPAYQSMRYGQSSLRWPSVRGTLLSADPAAEHTNDPSSELSTMGFPDDYELRYEYEVDGHKYCGDRFSFHYDQRAQPIRTHLRNVVERDDDKTADVATTAAAQHQATLHVDVFYDPDVPQRSCIRPGRPGDLWYPTSLCGVLLIGAVQLFRFALQRVPK